MSIVKASSIVFKPFCYHVDGLIKIHVLLSFFFEFYISGWCLEVLLQYFWIILLPHGSWVVHPHKMMMGLWDCRTDFPGHCDIPNGTNTYFVPDASNSFASHCGVPAQTKPKFVHHCELICVFFQNNAASMFSQNVWICI